VTPEERRRRAEYVVKMAEQGIIVEPAYDREQWRAENDAASPAPDAPTQRRRTARGPRKGAERRTA
jgi:hypothetical protein